jgi:hypothetical protein
MFPLALLSPRVIAEILIFVLLGAAGWWGYNWIYDRGAAHVQQKWDLEKASQDAASARVATDALATTKALQASADRDKETKNAQINTLNANLASAIAGLSNRPSRPDPGSVPSNPATGGGCTGAELYKPDAEFLAREASRGDALQAELQLCYSRYRAARDALK